MKNTNVIKGLNVIKTMQNTKRRSVGKVQASPYLDLYILNKEKERLFKEDERLNLRNKVIKMRIDEINKGIKGLQNSAVTVKTSVGKENKGGVKRKWKRMSLGY
ncbi:MAG: ankyrin [Nitrospirae bacterium]|nr:ankyrin [Nitrospirota bacterium]